MKENNDYNLKVSSFAALTLAFSSFGDAFLYPFLPVNFADVGIPSQWVGLLLSVNRFVRIISNTLIVHVIAKYGLRTIKVIAVTLALTSTFGYGLTTGVIAWIILRTIWGLAFSAMRIGTIGLSLQCQRPGFALGLSRALQESGPMIAIFFAPVLLKAFEPKAIFIFLGCMSLPAIYFALRLPSGKHRLFPVASRTFLTWPSIVNSITFVSAVVIDGIIVVILGVLFLQHRHQIDVVTATSLSAFYLGYRRLCLIIFSPLGGWLADRIGYDSVFNSTMAMVVIGLLIIAGGWIAAGAVVVFTFYSVNAAITPGTVSKNKSYPLVAAAENTTWRDIGAAVGTLSGGFLISSELITFILLIVTFVLAMLLVIHMLPKLDILKAFVLWK